MDGSTLTRRACLASAASLLAAPASARLVAGQLVELSILGIAEWRPSALVRELAPGFVAHAKDQLGYDVTVRFEAAPLAELYGKAASGFAAKSGEFNLVIADSQWLGAFASQKWILPLNPMLEANTPLEIEWFAPVVREAYQLFPDGSGNRWAMPQSGDVLALFVRRDLLTAPGEAETFRSKYGSVLPQSWDDFEQLTWDDYVRVLEFFDRPAQGYRGFISHRSPEYDYFACPAVSFILGRGGQLWDAVNGQVEGVLNTDANARALEEYVSLSRFQPDGAADIAGVTQSFTAGQVFSALQWVGAGAAMIPEGMRDKVMVVPPPGFRAGAEVVRRYVIGGQVWVLNDRIDEAHTQVATDFLAWWFRPETARSFAIGGGMPCDAASVSQPDFDAVQPWLRTYRAMLPRSGDFWHDPRFAELLAALQTGLAPFASGKLTDAKSALDLVACRQQAILFQEGSAGRQPVGGCPR